MKPYPSPVRYVNLQSKQGYRVGAGFVSGGFNQGRVDICLISSVAFLQMGDSVNKACNKGGGGGGGGGGGITPSIALLQKKKGFQVG